MPGDLLSMVSRSMGVYGTAPTCYLSALARLDAFALEDLDRAIEVERSLVRVRAMRYSVYALPQDLLLVAIAATRTRAMFPNSYRKQLADVYDDMAARVEAALVEGPLPATDLRGRVDPERSLGNLFSVLLGMMGAECRIVRATRTGGWRSDRLSYARWEDSLPGLDPTALDQREAQRRLAELYVAAYGPVGLDDLGWWAGWRKTETQAAADGVDLHAEGTAIGFLDGVRLLPVWDVLMVAYRDRERLLDPDHARFVYDPLGNATSVVLDQGRVVGVWDLGKRDDLLSITVAPLGRWPKQRWDDVETQANRIGTMIGATGVEIVRRAEPVDLTTAPRNRFLAPLCG